MKYTVLFLTLIASIFAGCKSENKPIEQRSSNDSASHQTKIAAALAKRGILYQRDSYDGGSINTLYSSQIAVEGIILTIGADKRETLKGTQLTINQRESHATAFLDSEDVSGFLSALKFLTSRAQEMQKSAVEYSELHYQGHDNFDVGFFQKGLNHLAFFEISGFPKTEVFMQIADLTGLSSLVEAAQKNLEHPVIKASGQADAPSNGLPQPPPPADTSIMLR